MTDLLSNLRAVALKYRESNPEREGGVVLVWQGQAYGWKNILRDAGQEQPGAYAVDEAGRVFIAKGGDAYKSAEAWHPLVEATAAS